MGDNQYKCDFCAKKVGPPGAFPRAVGMPSPIMSPLPLRRSTPLGRWFFVPYLLTYVCSCSALCLTTR